MRQHPRNQAASVGHWTVALLFFLSFSFSAHSQTSVEENANVAIALESLIIPTLVWNPNELEIFCDPSQLSAEEAQAAMDAASILHSWQETPLRAREHNYTFQDELLKTEETSRFYHTLNTETILVGKLSLLELLAILQRIQTQRQALAESQKFAPFYVDYRTQTQDDDDYWLAHSSMQVDIKLPEGYDADILSLLTPMPKGIKRLVLKVTTQASPLKKERAEPAVENTLPLLGPH